MVRRLGTAPILQAVIAPTKLAALRRIDSPEANARPVNFQRVAIDDAGLPYQVIGERNGYRPEDYRRKRRSDLEQVVDHSLVFGDAVTH